MSGAEYTPQPENISPPSSVTPTRHDSQQSQHAPSQPPHFQPYAISSEFDSPSSYLNHDAYTCSDGGSVYDSSATSSMNIPQSATMPEYEFYTQFADTTGLDQSWDSSAFDIGNHAPPQPEDDKTPVVSDTQRPISHQTFPAPPGATASAVRPISHPEPPLMSPFRPFGGHNGDQPEPSFVHGPPYPPMPEQMYYPVYATDPIMPPTHMPYGHPGFAVTMPMAYPEPSHYFPPAYPAPVPHHDYGPPRSRNPSPTSSITSAVSLARSASTSSELRPVRPKVKLSWEDKRAIIRIATSNTSLRQEDIAKMYGVDRSTVSKIINNPERWTEPQEVHLPESSRQVKSIGGRFPAVEASMDAWMDEQIGLGNDIRDTVAREQAKRFASEIGYPSDRFKASAKWLDKFKERRRAAGKLNSVSMVGHMSQYTYTVGEYGRKAMPGSIALSRSQSAMTLSSSDSSEQSLYQQSTLSNVGPTPEIITPHQMNRSEPDLVRIETTPSNRQRSQSSPQVIGEPGQQSPSSGKASRFVRPAALSLQRQNSYHGSSPSPRRPAPLTRASTSQGGITRRSRPTSLAASAFGITPINSNGQLPSSGSPVTSPLSAQAGRHSRQPSDASLAPFTSSMDGMSISPTMSDATDNGSGPTLPLTPVTPGHGSVGSVNSLYVASEYSDVNPPMEFGTAQRVVKRDNRPVPLQYSTMPNKHYSAHPFSMPQGQSSDFAPVASRS